MSDQGNLKVKNARAVGSSFHDVDLSRTVFDDVNLKGATFKNVALTGATIRDACLGDVVIEDANYSGMTIDGILVTDLLRTYREKSGG